MWFGTETIPQDREATKPRTTIMQNLVVAVRACGWVPAKKPRGWPRVCASAPFRRFFLWTQGAVRVTVLTTT